MAACGYQSYREQRHSISTRYRSPQEGSAPCTQNRGGHRETAAPAMSDPHPHRHSIGEAIVNARKSSKWVPCADISVDAAFLIIRQVERRRDSPFGRVQGEALYRLVADMCFQTGFDSGRRRLYQLVIMAYYRIIKARRARAQKIRALRQQQRQQQLSSRAS